MQTARKPQQRETTDGLWKADGQQRKLSKTLGFMGIHELRKKTGKKRGTRRQAQEVKQRDEARAGRGQGRRAGEGDSGVDWKSI